MKNLSLDEKLFILAWNQYKYDTQAHNIANHYDMTLDDIEAKVDDIYSRILKTRQK